MYGKEEMQIINLDDNYTLLYPFLARSLIERCGERGEKAVREGTRRFGRDRAETLRDKHIKMNVKINMHSLFAVGHDLPSDPRFRRELKALNPQERVSHTLYCPMAAIWKEYGCMDIGRIYCEEFHNACYGTYAYGYTKVNLAKTQTQEGDEYCAFNVVLRPENLPDELKPVCFAEFDPQYEGPLSEILPAYGKSGFGTLFIKLYFHLLTTAEEMLGKEGVEAVRLGLNQLACDAAVRLLKSAKEQGVPMSREFVDANYPLALDADQEPLWNLYSGNNGKEAKRLLKEAFYEIFLREAGLDDVRG